MSNTQTTGNATNQPIPQYPPAINIGGGMGGFSPFGPQREIIDTVNQLRDKVIELEGKITVLTSLIKK
jgi:hypothetical protein